MSLITLDLLAPFLYQFNIPKIPDSFLLQFKKFGKPSDIPNHFIEKRMKFSGRVVRVQGGKKPILYIDHFPILPLPFRTVGKQLPVEVST